MQPHVDDDTFGNNDKVPEEDAKMEDESEVAIEAKLMMEPDTKDPDSTTLGFSVDTPEGRKKKIGPSTNSQVAVPHSGPSSPGQQT